MALYNGFAGGNGTIWMDNVQCVGIEGRLVDCNPRLLKQLSANCTHSNDAGVTCSKSEYGDCHS